MHTTLHRMVVLRPSPDCTVDCLLAIACCKGHCIPCFVGHVQEQLDLNDRLHIRYGHQLYGQGEFEEALGHLSMVSYPNPVILLRLFPSLAPETLLQPLLPSIAGDLVASYNGQVACA